MGIASKSPHGQISGKIGYTVGYQLNGQYVVRSLPDYENRKPSELTMRNRDRMKVTSLFLRPLKHVLEFGYQSIAPKGSRVGTFQAAQSYVFKNALAYTADNIPYVDPGKVLVFRGPLDPPQELKVTREGDVLHLSWKKTPSYVLVVLAYNEHESFVEFNHQGIASDAGSYSWSAPFTKSFHVYAAFYDVLSGKLSDSFYGGQLERLDV